MLRILTLAFVSLLFACCNGKFLGGTISWMNVPGNAVRFQYRMSWEKGTGPCGHGCNRSMVGIECANFTPEVARLAWTVHDGNTTQHMDDVKYVTTSVSESDVNGWEQGEYILTYKPKKPQFTVSLSDIPWVLSGGENSSRLGYLETFVDTRTRNDTGKPNASPYCALPPFIGVSFECTTVVLLPAEDPEGERVRCRWATPSECGQACTNVPNNTVHLDRTKCSLTIKAYNSTGYLPDAIYRLTIVIEDVSPATLTMGTAQVQRGEALARVPIQLSLHVASASTPCNQNGQMFVIPTPTDRARPSYDIFDYMRHKTVELSFYLETKNISAAQFLLSGPMFLQYTVLQDDQASTLNRTNVTRLHVTWQPKIPLPWQQVSYQQICVWGLDENSVSTNAYCITDIVTDTGDFCKTKVKCQNNGTCLNLFKDPNEKCICPPSFKGDNCSRAMGCHDDPCENNGMCIPQHSGGYSCRCNKGYTGINCEDEVSACMSSPCQNGGICLDSHLSYTCRCMDKYVGTRCATKRSGLKVEARLHDSPDWLFIFLAILAILMVAMSIIGCVALCYKKAKSTVVRDEDEMWASPRTRTE